MNWQERSATSHYQTALAIQHELQAGHVDEANIGMQLSDRQWFREAMAPVQHPSFEVILGRAHGRPTIGVAAPIRSRGRTLGVVAGGLDFEQLRRVIRDIDPARSDRLDHDLRAPPGPVPRVGAGRRPPTVGEPLPAGLGRPAGEVPFVSTAGDLSFHYRRTSR